MTKLKMRMVNEIAAPDRIVETISKSGQDVHFVFSNIGFYLVFKDESF